MLIWLIYFLISKIFVNINDSVYTKYLCGNELSSRNLYEYYSMLAILYIKNTASPSGKYNITFQSKVQVRTYHIVLPLLNCSMRKI